MKRKLSLKVVTVMVLFFCGFFVMQSFAIKTEEAPITVEESIEVTSEIDEDMPDLNFCRYKLGFVFPEPGAPAWFQDGITVCTRCTQGGPTDQPCASPFGSNVTIRYKGVVIGTATSAVAQTRTCTGCRVGEFLVKL